MMGEEERERKKWMCVVVKKEEGIYGEPL